MKRLNGTALVLVLFVLGAAALPPGAARQLPAPEKFVLKNGLTVYHLRNSDLPVVSFRMVVRGAGSAYEPAASEGAAGLAAALMMKGTSKMGADAIAEALDFMGANLGITASEEYAQVDGDSLAEHFPRLMEIAAGCLTDPAFAADEFEKERSLTIDGLKAAKDNPGSAVPYYFQKAYFGSHPMGYLASGTETSLKTMTTQAVKDFYKKRFRPGRAVAAVVGDIEKAKLVPLLEGTIGRMTNPAGRAPADTIPALPRPKGRKLLLIDKPDATQAYFMLGAPGYAMGDKVTAAASAMNTLFGGRFTSWLNTELRIKRGLTYGAGSNARTWAAGGLFTVSSYTKNDKIGEMLGIVFDLLEKGAKEGFSAEELESSRNYILGQFPPTLEKNASKAGAYVRLAFYKLGFDQYDKYLNEVGRLTPALVKAAAAALLPQEDFVLVVVGKAAEIRPLLAKYGTWQEKKITDPDF
ncbi:MAG: pitrilysin family protein [Candidatus Aminicenantes bacterium]|nr:pitrilysin family protein [Candidatus Aminicenantes bacterium]